MTTSCEHGLCRESMVRDAWREEFEFGASTTVNKSCWYYCCYSIATITESDYQKSSTTVLVNKGMSARTPDSHSECCCSLMKVPSGYAHYYSTLFTTAITKASFF